MSMNFTTEMLIYLMVYRRRLKHLWTFKARKKSLLLKPLNYFTDFIFLVMAFNR